MAAAPEAVTADARRSYPLAAPGLEPVPGGASAGLGGRPGRRAALRAALARDPLLTDADLARRLGVSVPTVRLDRGALGIPEVRDRARAVAARHLGQGQAGGPTLRGEVLDLLPGVSALALLGAEPAGPGDLAWSQDPALFGDAEALALAASGLAPAAVEVVNVKFLRSLPGAGRLVAKAEVLRGRGAAGRSERRVVLVQIRIGDATVLRAKFVVVAVGEARPALRPGGVEAGA